ncbi:MAG: carboxypeptidase regulatory-like domain-containing protein [Kiritimatiellae bacterium]|nr:carboxypeptidase regulatory-like domain-containing protein [Kiritimatiellia bacterium]
MKMKFRSFSFVFVLAMANATFAYSPIIDGALADVRIKVIDDMGESVPDAKVAVVIYKTPDKADTKRGVTDADGCFSTAGRSYGEVEVYASKDGYYDTHTTAAFKNLPDKEVEKRRIWSDGTVETKVVLKKKRNPVTTVFHSVDYANIPATNEVVCLDLETFKWCPPYGEGKHDDLHLFYESWRNPTNWFSYFRKLTISAPNCVDGFYRRKVDSASKFRYDYYASPNAPYVKEFKHVVDRRSGNFDEVSHPSDDEYFIFRVRTATNEVGEVVHANYGRIGEKSGHMFGLRMKAWFNTKANDTNLEDARLR